jgi:hypothetical protein
VAAGVAAAQATYRYDETPQAYLTRLRPKLTAEMYQQFARAVSTAALQDRRARDHEIATARASIDRLRMIAPTSVIAIVQLNCSTTTIAGSRHHSKQLVITAVKTHHTWMVSDIQPASLGDNGDTTDNATPDHDTPD